MVFHIYYKLICILYALLCGQNFILVKSGCYRVAGEFNAIKGGGGFKRGFKGGKMKARW
jgi:hypothetical protein